MVGCGAVSIRCVSQRGGKSSGVHPHNDRAVAWHVLAIENPKSSEECPHSPVSEPSYDPMGDVGFSHVDDGARQATWQAVVI